MSVPKSTKLIPVGIYCHSVVEVNSSDGGKQLKRKPCPYWMLHSEKRTQENGYCEFLDQGDWEGKGGLLWDQVKECCIKTGCEDEHGC